MSKPSFTKGEWVCIDEGQRVFYTNSPLHTVDLMEQRIGGKQTDHYRLKVDGKYVPRLSFYGETAWMDVSRYARDHYGVDFQVFV